MQPCDEVRTKMKMLQEDWEATFKLYEAHVLEQEQVACGGGGLSETKV